jgi:hypothetical protein
MNQNSWNSCYFEPKPSITDSTAILGMQDYRTIQEYIGLSLNCYVAFFNDQTMIIIAMITLCCLI